MISSQTTLKDELYRFLVDLERKKHAEMCFVDNLMQEETAKWGFTPNSRFYFRDKEQLEHERTFVKKVVKALEDGFLQEDVENEILI